LKRTVQRPWARKKDGGWVFWNPDLVKTLKAGDVVEFGKIRVGTDQLRRLLNLMPYPDSLIRANGRLEVETVQRINKRLGEGCYRTSFRKPRKNYSFFALVNGA
jgi:hypothetical protein